MTFAYDAACRGGTVVFVGAQAPGSELTLPANELHASAKQIIGCAYGSAQLRRDVPRLVALAESGALNLDIMISERLGLDDINTAIDIMARGDVIRSVLIP
jgi:Zn-dependent alcohol dehydrogenase